MVYFLKLFPSVNCPSLRLQKKNKQWSSKKVMISFLHWIWVRINEVDSSKECEIIIIILLKLHYKTEISYKLKKNPISMQLPPRTQFTAVHLIWFVRISVILHAVWLVYRFEIVSDSLSFTAFLFLLRITYLNDILKSFKYNLNTITVFNHIATIFIRFYLVKIIQFDQKLGLQN